METKIRMVGNSAGAIIPASILRKLKLHAGDTLSIEESDGKIILAANKPRYSLDELLAKCDSSEPMPEELSEWDQAHPVGKEV
ncbi:MAG: AbrB/MazE/SpoVT family DNA-binding domain-containing protein [Candidatus Polarisedimenticolaceae bacterium]|nr:AbrB/MazE/SpoVT family DNA-binding domain-containing protein [Candidatus Polarisedimenticolaceae bacterium]